MATYKTPGVYVEEKSTLPPSVAEVSTAIPAFLGYTERGSAEDGPVIARISTLLDYEQLFGRAKPSTFAVLTDLDGKVAQVSRAASDPAASALLPEYLMYYAVSHYFKNGGGACYIVSVGGYQATPSPTALSAGLERLKQEDEPTLLVLGDAVNLPTTDYYALCDEALRLCQQMQDRFAIFDVKQDAKKDLTAADPYHGKDDVAVFRGKIGTNHLSYGAAYYPYLETSLSYAYDESGVSIQLPYRKELAPNTLTVSSAAISATVPSVTVTRDAGATAISFTVAAASLTISATDTSTGADIAAAWSAWKSTAGNQPHGFDIVQAGDGSAAPAAAAKAALSEKTTLAAIKSANTALYNQVKATLQAQRVILPPSAAIAGVYASVDRERGVWKAPANVSVAATVGPITKITRDAQEDYNVDPTAGKSVNAIRAFTGKGTLIWGARTLAGNDNEWRYVSVRRLFIMIEESAQKATAFAVFEPNDMTTWLKVKGMIESFLYGLWERGALAGPTPAAAYFVHVGLGKTMNTQDILEGRMIVEIGVAAVRPAEFIILRFTHKLQEA